MPSVNKKIGGKNLWVIPELWKNETVFVLGGGYSLKNIIHGSLLYDKLSNKKVVAIHYAIKAYPLASLWFSGDARCYWELKEDIDRYPGIKVSLNIITNKVRSLEKIDGFFILNTLKGKGLSPFSNKNRVYYNGSSGGSAIDLVAKLGANKIILYGYDMRYTPIPSSYQSPHSKEKIIDGWKSNLSIWRNIASDCNMRKIELVNCTPNSELPVITKGNLEDYL